MKIWQIASIGSLAIILGCGGMGAYVPDGVQNNGNPVQCAALSVVTSSTVSVALDSDTEENLTVINGNLQALQSRAPGDADVTFAVTGLPAGLSVNFVTSPLTVGLDSSASTTVRYVTDGAQEGTYNIQIITSQAGCTPITTTVQVIVFNNQNT